MGEGGGEGGERGEGGGGSGGGGGRRRRRGGGGEENEKEGERGKPVRGTTFTTLSIATSPVQPLALTVHSIRRIPREPGR